MQNEYLKLTLYVYHPIMPGFFNSNSLSNKTGRLKTLLDINRYVK